MGGHYDIGNVSGLGAYHFHCGGNKAHLHINGACSYGFNRASPIANGIAYDPETVKTIQQKLNAKGYNCGAPSGLLNAETMHAIKQFQKDSGLKPTGLPDAATQSKITGE